MATPTGAPKTPHPQNPFWIYDNEIIVSREVVRRRDNTRILYGVTTRLLDISHSGNRSRILGKYSAPIITTVGKWFVGWILTRVYMEEMDQAAYRLVIFL